jgi:hypothetical protein
MSSLLLLLVACHKKPPVAWETGAAPRGSIAVAPVVRVADVPAPPLPPLAPPTEIEAQLDSGNLPAPTALDPVNDAAFLRNEFLGNVRFGGGFVRAGAVQLEVRGRLIEFAEQERYDAMGRAWLDQTLDALLDGAAAAPAPSDLAVDRVPTRGLHPDDGHDNVNVPRTTLAARDLGHPLEAAGADYVLVPYLRNYYTHNGGWFLGQEYGCMAGARVEVLLALYDADTGAVVWSLAALGRTISARQGQPSRAEADQNLLWAEDEVEETLRKRLPR